MTENEIRKIVSEKYGQLARQASSCCQPGNQSCCGGISAKDISKRIGYSESQMASAPDEANLGLGCGNPTAIASLVEGETVLDLGSGAGFDCFLAADKVGAKGKVIGVDMTPEMIFRARENSRKNGYGNVEFRLGELENLPLADGIIDVALSNCVINLVPDKKRVFSELYRVLKPSGRFIISDIVLTRPLPERIKQSILAYVGCVAGAIMKDDYIAAIKQAGFIEVEVVTEKAYDVQSLEIENQGEKASAAGTAVFDDYGAGVISMTVKGVKPK